MIYTQWINPLIAKIPLEAAGATVAITAGGWLLVEKGEFVWWLFAVAVLLALKGGKTQERWWGAVPLSMLMFSCIRWGGCTDSQELAVYLLLILPVRWDRARVLVCLPLIGMAMSSVSQSFYWVLGPIALGLFVSDRRPTSGGYWLRLLVASLLAFAMVHWIDAWAHRKAFWVILGVAWGRDIVAWLFSKLRKRKLEGAPVPRRWLASLVVTALLSVGVHDVWKAKQQLDWSATVLTSLRWSSFDRDLYVMKGETVCTFAGNLPWKTCEFPEEGFVQIRIKRDRKGRPVRAESDVMIPIPYTSFHWSESFVSPLR